MRYLEPYSVERDTWAQLTYGANSYQHESSVDDITRRGTGMSNQCSKVLLRYSL